VGIIQELPELVVNKIAAGEVIERPASIIKELVENSIDAQATRIEIQLEEGGRKLVRVTDDGVGMDESDVVMAFHPHATSKLRTSQDLFFITTMGFRGEALASIGSVARVRLVSRLRGAASAHEIEAAGGRLSEAKAAGAPEGTTLEVRDLFFNTPARQKFLRTPKTELGHVMDMVTRIALPHEQIHFIVTNDGKPILNAPPTPDRRGRLAAFFGQDIARDLLAVDGGEGPLRVEGFAAPPALSRSTSATQFLFLNRRYVRDRALSSAIRESYQGLLAPGRFPVLFLFLQIDPREVDVNVHPTKIEVRFRQGRQVYVTVLGALRGALAKADLAPPLRPTAPVPTSWDQVRQAVMGGGPAAGTRDRTDPTDRTDRTDPAEWELKNPPQAARLPFSGLGPPDHLEDARTIPRTMPPPSMDPFAAARPAAPFFQIHHSYIIEETPTGFRVTDQHALHERVLYEELLRRSEGAGVEAQRLLLPEVVQLNAREAAVASAILEPLRALGVQAEEFGERTLAVHALPRLVGSVDAGQLIHDLLAELSEEESREEAETTVERQRQRLARALACKAAVKAGDRLRPSEIEALLARRDALGSEAETCPHGRPTSLLFSLDEMERQFKRK